MLRNILSNELIRKNKAFKQILVIKIRREFKLQLYLRKILNKLKILKVCEREYYYPLKAFECTIKERH
jgi:hypothetical protein